MIGLILTKKRVTLNSRLLMVSVLYLKKSKRRGTTNIRTVLITHG